MSAGGPGGPGGVVVVGSANLDLVASLRTIPAPGETVLAEGVDQRAGGKGLNQAVAAARAGAPVTLIAAVGRDDAAEVLLEAADGAGVDRTAVRRLDDVASGSAWIMVAADGENAIVVDAGANSRLLPLTREEERRVQGASVVVAQLEVPVATVAEAARAARASGARFVLNAAPAQALDDDLLALVDVLVVNEGEADALFGPGADLARQGVPAVVVTLGAAGVRVVDAAGVRDVPGVPADVVDTTGAGDTFVGYLAAALAGGEPLDDAAARAVVAGALAVETSGAVPSIPTADTVARRREALR